MRRLRQPATRLVMVLIVAGLLGAGWVAEPVAEVGDYGRAVDVVQRMVDRKLTLASDGRELPSDLAGSIEAMELAAEAGTPGTESRSGALALNPCYSLRWAEDLPLSSDALGGPTR
jgi:hypothetical protein